MKGLLHALVGILCLLGSSNLLAQPIFTIESEDAAAGTELCLDITADDFDNIFGFQFTINYDTDVLEFTSSTGVTLGGSPVNINNSAPGDIRVQWSLFAIEGVTNFDPFLVGTLCFNILSDQETTIIFSSSIIAAEVTGQSGQVQGVTYTDGVVNEGNVGALSDVVFDFGNGQINPGQTVCQSVTVSDFTDISSFQFTINNPLGAVVATPTLQNPHPSLTGTLGITGNNTAIISYDHGGGSVSLADGLVAFEICHDIPSSYTDPNPKVITEGAAGMATTGSGETAGIDVFPGTASPPAGGSDDFIFDLSDGSGAVGTTVCLDVTVNAFEAVGSFQFSLNYDIGVLQWESFSNLAFPDIQASQPSSSPGQIRVSWVYNNSDNAGGTLNDGDVLLTVCFQVLADSETDVVFSNTPIATEAFDNNLVPFNIITDDGTINAGSTGGPSCNDGIQNGTETGVDCGGNCAPCSAGNDELTFSLSDGSGNVGQQVCLDLTTSNHTDITAWQFSINFDTDFLAYTNFTSNPAYGAMSSDVQVFNSAPGVLRVIWSDNTTEFDGFSFPDGTVLATFCFTIVDDGPTTVDITSDPIVIVAVNDNGQPLPVTTNDGSVNGGVTATCNDGIQNGNETGVDCGGNCTPCVSCSNGIQDGNETGVDCGGPDCAPCDPGNGDELLFDLQDGSGGVGSQVCLNITTANFTSITAFQFSVNLDGAVLDFVSSSYNADFDDIGSPVLINEDSGGDIRIIWVDQELNGVTFVDGETVVTLCFTILDDSQTSIALSGNPISVTGSNTSGNSVDIIVNGAQVNGSGQQPTCNDGIQNGNETGVDCGGPDCTPCMTMGNCNDGQQNGQETGVDCGGPDCSPCTGDLVFDLVNATCDGDGNVCVNLITTGFTSITGFQLDVNFDDADMTYVDFTPNPLFAAMGSPITSFLNGSAIRLLFVDGTLEFEGISVDDFTVLGTFCFSNVADGSTDLTITGITATDDSGSAIPSLGFGATVSCGGDAPTCNDGIQNGNETGVDCGGPDCAPCPPTCNDGIQNGDEEGVDCGGSSCAPCMTMANCNDGQQNGQETGVDCGGPDCSPCTGDLVFDLVNATCDGDGNACVNLITTGFTSITGFQLDVNFDDADMTYVDFTPNPLFAAMGSPITSFLNGSAIRLLFVDGTLEFEGISVDDFTVLGTFCFSNVTDGSTDLTITGITATDDSGSAIPSLGFGATVSCGGDVPTCNDGIQNGNETGVDCGGPDCAPCPPTCTDGIQNGDEEGVDCGGSNCAPCMTMANCNDGQQNGQETGVDCGGPDCSPCTGDLVFDLVNTTCDGDGNACVDLITTGFTSITGFQLDVNFDDADMTYVDFTPNPLFATMGSPITSFLNGSAIRLLFVDGTLEFEGISVDDFTVLGTFCFSNVADESTDLTITGITATDDSGSAIPALGFGATVSCGGDVPTCNDGIQNGNETGVDCGGPDCLPCPPTCTDGIQNGDEEGIDCGGSSCMPCMSDPTCDDGMQNGQETGVDCGGPDCAPCTTDLVFDLIDASCDSDGNVCVDLVTTGFITITGFQLDVNFDDADMTYVDFTPNPLFAAMGSPITSFLNGSTIRLLFVDGTLEFEGITVDDFTVLGTFCFSNVAEGDTDLTITGITATDDSGSAISAQGFGATVSCGDGGNEPTCDDGIQNGNETGIDCGGPDCDPCDTCDDGIQNGNETGIDCGGDCNACETDVTFTLTNGTGAVGTQVCVDVVGFDFQDITDFQFSLSYDPTLLQFMSATGVTQLPGLMATSGSPGQISVEWDGSGAVSLANGSEVLEVCFMVLGPDACTADVTFSNIPTPISANNANNDIVTVSTNNGVINPGNPCGDPPPNLVLDIGDASGGEGSQICLDVSVEDFIDLTDLQFSATFDPDILTFDGGGDFNLPGLGSGNFTLSSPGVITFSWENPGTGGVTIGDGTVVFSLCFTIDAVAETVVQPSNTPTAIFAMNGMNQSVGVVPSAGIVNAGVPTTDGLTFIIGSGSGSVGETVCIPVTVFNFDALAGFQFGIVYDPSVIEFENGLSDPCPTSGGPIFDCLPGFMAANQINGANAGDIRVTWDDQSLSDRQLADGSVIFELCFNVLTEDCAAVSFGDIIAVQFFNANVELLPATLVNGSVNCTAAPMIVDADVQNTSCDVDTDGSISLTVVGGGNLTYSWTPNIGDGPVVENLESGIYTVIITNPSTGQSTSATYTVSNPPPFSIDTVSVVDERCSGENNGSITIATIGGAAPYTIDWSGNLQDGLIQQINLSPGLYSVTVTDNNGCSREIIDIEVGSPPPVIASGSITPITGPGTGAVNLLVQGGTPDYTYMWSGPNNFEADTEDISGLSDPGTYCVTVTDSRGCNRPQCFNVPEDNCIITFDTDTNSGCFGEANGSIDLTITSSTCVTGVFEFTWTNSDGDTISTMEDLEGLEPGVYFVNIAQGNSMVSGSVTLNPPTAITVSDTTITPANSGDNGAIDIQVTMGFPPYTYVWTEGMDGDTIATTRDIDGLAAGTYCVVITDGNDCAVQECYEITGEPASVVSSQSFNALCTDSLGSIQIVMANVAFPISATTSPGSFTASSDSSMITIQVPSGTYDVTIMDSQGQEVSVTGLMVDEPVPIVLDNSTVVSNVDEAACSGSITLNLSGGTGDYDIVWNQEGLSGPQPMPLCEGTYSATVTDDNGCEFVVDDLVVGLLTGEGTTTLVDCPGDATGTVDVTVDGGEGPYEYSWSQEDNPDFSADTEDLENVPEGSYTVVITDATGAMLVRTFEVETAMGFAVTASVTSDYNGFGVSCPNDANASLEASVSGMGTFTYEWRRNGSPIGDNSPVLTNVPAGEYNLIVTSEANCVVDQILLVTEPEPIEIVANITDASCEDARDGRIELSVSGGVGGYEYFWQDGRDEPFVNFLRPNSYSVEVSDANDCFVTQTFRVEAPEVLSATATATDATDGCNGSINVTVSGGNGNYTYQWPQLVGQEGPSAEELCPGEYMIVVRDGGGCQSFTVTVVVRDRRFPCLSAREVITPNGDGLNEAFILFCTDGEGFSDNTLEIYNRWGQLVFTVDNYDCSQDGGSNCFIGQNNDGVDLPEGPYYYVLDYANPSGDRQQLRGSLTILRE